MKVMCLGEFFHPVVQEGLYLLVVFPIGLNSLSFIASAESRLRCALAATLGDWRDSGTQQAIRELARMMETVGVTSVHA